MVDRCKSRQTKLQRLKRPHQILVTQTDVTSLVGWSVRLGFLAIGIALGLGLGIWYGSLNNGISFWTSNAIQVPQTSKSADKPLAPEKLPTTVQEPIAIQPEKLVVPAPQNTVGQVAQEDPLTRKINDLLLKVRRK